VHPTTARPTITVTTDGAGVVSHVGSRLLAGLADRSGLTAAFSDAVADLRERHAGHDPGRVMTDLAVLLADGGRSISDLAVLRDQPTLFGPVASTATAWRVLDKIDPAALNRLRAARAQAREQLWAQRAENVGPIAGHRAGGRTWPGLRILFDATAVTAHSDRTAHFTYSHADLKVAEMSLTIGKNVLARVVWTFAYQFGRRQIREQLIREQLIREQLPAITGQKREHTARPQFQPLPSG
jgi:hypothetical protein